MGMLIETIRDLVQKAQSAPNITEADTKAVFIEPLLGELGWDMANLDAVTREYRVYDNTLIDYALKVGGKPQLFVEAKPLRRSLDDKAFIAQTVNYANNEGVTWCVLTNGLQYRVYKSNEPAEMERKLLFEVDLRDIEDPSKDQEVTRRLTYLSRDSIESGVLDHLGESQFTDQRVRAAMTELLDQPPNALVKIVLDKLASTGALPKDKVRDSLRRMATLLGGTSQPAPPPPLPVGSPARVTTPGWISLDSLGVELGSPPPPEIRLPDGTTTRLRSWRDILVEVVRFLIGAGRVGPTSCPIRLPRAHSRYLVHTAPQHADGKPFRSPAEVAGLWVETHASASWLHNQTLFLIRHVGLNPADFQVRTQ